MSLSFPFVYEFLSYPTQNLNNSGIILSQAPCGLFIGHQKSVGETENKFLFYCNTVLHSHSQLVKYILLIPLLEGKISSRPVSQALNTDSHFVGTSLERFIPSISVKSKSSSASVLRKLQVTENFMLQVSISQVSKSHPLLAVLQDIQQVNLFYLCGKKFKH